ncbi:E3 ubiquitin-protein ligase RNF182 [Polypterus senegalus]
MSGPMSEVPVDACCTEELECKICYNQYNLKSRRPKVLECCHRMCAKCLTKLVDLEEPPRHMVTCPFCRFETCLLSGDAVDELPDDHNIVTALAFGKKSGRYLQENSAELLLSPKRLTSFVNPSHDSSSNCLVITIMEVQGDTAQAAGTGPPVVELYQPSGFNPIAAMSRRWALRSFISSLCQTSGRVLVWLLGLLYFSSLPLGVYLLVLREVTLGIVFVSLVPSSLLIFIIYGFCQCFCHKLLDCISS